MAKIKFLAVFPASRDKLWRIFELHLNDTIKAIHPNVLSQRIVSEHNSEIVFERIIRSVGRTQRSEWKYKLEPPDKLRWEIIAGEGPFAKGSYIENTYKDIPEGTQITTDGEIILKGVPRFLQRWVLAWIFGRIDNEDLTYLRKHIPQEVLLHH